MKGSPGIGVYDGVFSPPWWSVLPHPEQFCLIAPTLVIFYIYLASHSVHSHKMGSELNIYVRHYKWMFAA